MEIFQSKTQSVKKNWSIQLIKRYFLPHYRSKNISFCCRFLFITFSTAHSSIQPLFINSFNPCMQQDIGSLASGLSFYLVVRSVGLSVCHNFLKGLEAVFYRKSVLPKSTVMCQGLVVVVNISSTSYTYQQQH